MIYYTADLHIGHTNVLRHCDRPFINVEDMNEALIRNWNARINRLDTVYIIGDLFFRNKVPAETYLSVMKGRKHLITGNHDSSWMKKTNWPVFFESVNAFQTIKDSGRLITMCHYPMMTWPGRDSYMVFGHIHNATAASFWPLIRDNPRMLNAGVDVNSFMPVTLEELIENNQRFKHDHPTASTSQPQTSSQHALSQGIPQVGERRSQADERYPQGDERRQMEGHPQREERPQRET